VQPSSITWACPHRLLTPQRLDLAIKWRFFRHLIDGDDAGALAAYRTHIDGRTGGIEPGSWKQTVDDYATACRDLLRSMQANGFDAESPIVVGANGGLRNGAHRAACAVALGIPAAVRHSDKPSRARPWDADWLRSHGTASADISRAQLDTEELRHEQDCRCHCQRGHGAPHELVPVLC
jgi:hypothetical protein